LRIAYDLRFATDHFAGIGTHAFCLLEALLELPGDERYLVLWNPALAHTRFEFARRLSHPRVEVDERAWRPLDPRDPFRVGAWLRSRRPTLFLSPFYFLPFGAPCPCVLTIHDVWPLRYREGLSWSSHQLYRLSLARARGARRILTSSEFSREEIIHAAGIPADRVRAIRLGTPPSRDVAARRPANLHSDRFALVVGDNRPRKNLEVLARAWGSFGAAPPMDLVAAGTADPRWPDLAKWAARYRATGVEHLGWLPEVELAWLYRNAQCLLFPSLYEGFGFPLVEAMALGVPIVASDIPPFREIADGVVQFASPTDPDAWAEAVRSVAPVTGQRLGTETARARATELTYRRTAEQTLVVLHELLRGTGGG
jgi:glycosyltransferase involved in cell wall biosynthesis